MKKQKKTMIIITFATLIIVLVALCFLPDTIPLHFGATGASNFGSKYFLLLFIPIPAGLYWAFCHRSK
ncbi:TPA: DUF1648 domain-containing protein [Clostridioides difficile]|jgi:uncharacterized membrane protein|nr:DUF1648 domain-containing protein [Clostridioides difficile]HCU2904005.1 DUF1648 domain-containing protein [Clostridioides difficile]HCU2965144.1 DUF1648 domain-containing protein [Clostridioides difficile]HDC4921483.1 DUF1648 domain-containing protein [Clostridioides difficile]HDC5103074.1 DUF1648 domain-containing protein [Clostridioides difficile]